MFDAGLTLPLLMKLADMGLLRMARGGLALEVNV